MGAEFARQIAHREPLDELWLIARNKSALDSVGKTLEQPFRSIPADLTDQKAIDDIKALLADEKPNVSMIVNCAGFGRFGSYREVGIADANSMIALNVTALVDLTQLAIPYMPRGGRIVEVASCSAFTPLPDMNVYAATKAFVVSYTRALRFELKGTGITATAVCPAWVKTGFEKAARSSEKGTGNKAVRHLLFAQKADTVVSRALLASDAHVAVVCCGIPAFLLRIVGKFLPHWLTMLGWEGVRHI